MTGLVFSGALLRQTNVNQYLSQKLAILNMNHRRLEGNLDSDMKQKKI